MSEIYRGFYQTVPELMGIFTHRDAMEAIDILDEIEDVNLKTEISGSMIACPVSVASFLLGYCGNLAEYLHKKYGYRIGILYTYSDETVSTEHVYNIAKMDGRKVYIDSRGITSDPDVFFSLYNREGWKTGTKEFTSLKRAKKWRNNWHFINDAISDAMIKWLVREYPDYYDVKKLEKKEE